MSIIYIVGKKENALIILSAMEIHYQTSSFYYYALFQKFRTPLHSEPGTTVLRGSRISTWVNFYPSEVFLEKVF